MQLHICCKLFDALIAAVSAYLHMWGFAGFGREAGVCFHGREFNDDVLAMEDDLFRSSRSSVIQLFCVTCDDVE